MDCYWLFEQNNIDEYVKKLLKKTFKISTFL